MGRRERRARRKARRQDEQEWGVFEGADAPVVVEVDESMPGMEWGDGDELVPRAEEPTPDPWKAVRLGTVRDVAHLFQVHWKTVEKWRRRDGLPCLRHGGVIRYALSDVLRWASARKVGE